jgi:hypothetical protein
MAILGGVLLTPLTARLPVLGWDWYFFFTAHHPIDNLYNPLSPFFPFTRYIIELLTWLPWRTSFAVLNGITLMSIALGCWQAGGRYLSIFLAILTPPVFYVMWVGHTEGLALLGVLSGIVPLALINPQVTLWNYLKDRPSAMWAGAFLALVLLIWPSWISHVSGTVWNHSASFGWHALGWPVLVLGLILLAGAGSNPWRLMAAGCMLSPDLMPYHLVVLLPSLGTIKGYRQLVLFAAIWLTVPGVGLGGSYRWLNLVFPLAAYGLNYSLKEYIEAIKLLIGQPNKMLDSMRGMFALTGERP